MGGLLGRLSSEIRSYITCLKSDIDLKVRHFTTRDKDLYTKQMWSLPTHYLEYKPLKHL